MQSFKIDRDILRTLCGPYTRKQTMSLAKGYCMRYFGKIDSLSLKDRFFHSATLASQLKENVHRVGQQISTRQQASFTSSLMSDDNFYLSKLNANCMDIFFRSRSYLTTAQARSCFFDKDDIGNGEKQLFACLSNLINSLVRN